MLHNNWSLISERFMGNKGTHDVSVSNVGNTVPHVVLIVEQRLERCLSRFKRKQ